MSQHKSAVKQQSKQKESDKVEAKNKEAEAEWTK